MTEGVPVFVLMEQDTGADDPDLAYKHQQKDLSIIFEYINYNVLTDGQIYISLIHTLIRLYISIP